MLYIDDVGNNTVRFGHAVGGGDYAKYLPNNMAARSSEQVGGDSVGRVWITDTDTNESVVDCYDPALITLDGVVYANPGNFVQAFNAMVEGDELVLATTTTTTELATTTTTT